MDIAINGAGGGERRVRCLDACVNHTDHDALAFVGDGRVAAPDRVGVDPARTGVGLRLADEITDDALDAGHIAQQGGLAVAQFQRHAIGGEVVDERRLQVSANTLAAFDEALAALPCQIVTVGHALRGFDIKMTRAGDGGTGGLQRHRCLGFRRNAGGLETTETGNARLFEVHQPGAAFTLGNRCGRIGCMSHRLSCGDKPHAQRNGGDECGLADHRYFRSSGKHPSLSGQSGGASVAPVYLTAMETRGS
ncbi:MAG TPA: hypothetical protein P5171_07825 [Xanthomonadaceae bacterium]|nr:hypothetical protein [Xanthomonadaceae bacterium]